MAPEDRSDEELIELLSRDHLESFEELYRRYSSRIYSYYLRRLPQEDAQDLTQRCFMRLHDKAHTFNPKFPAAAWIFTVARNLMNDLFRQRKNDGKLQAAMAPMETIDLAQFWLELQDELASLDEKQRNVIIWRYREGRDFDEIAQLLATSPANARQLVSRAIRNLRQIAVEE